MTTFRCEKFPEGNIRTTVGRIVSFTGGLAVVDDPEVAQALREVPEVFGVAEVTAAAAPETCPVCGARQDIPAPPVPVEPAAQSTEDTDTGDAGGQQSTPDSGAGDQGQGDTGDEGLDDDGNTVPVVLERPGESATRGDWLVYVAAALARPQSAFKGMKLHELKALVPLPE